jgi:hypothetical protein
MPRGDGTGPMGMGPMTGRGAGYCNGSTAPGFANAGAGFGCGRGNRRMFYATGMPGWTRFGGTRGFQAGPNVLDEKEFLSRQAQALEQELALVKKQLSSFDSKKDE